MSLQVVCQLKHAAPAEYSEDWIATANCCISVEMMVMMMSVTVMMVVMMMVVVMVMVSIVRMEVPMCAAAVVAAVGMRMAVVSRVTLLMVLVMFFDLLLIAVRVVPCPCCSSCMCDCAATCTADVPVLLRLAAGAARAAAFFTAPIGAGRCITGNSSLLNSPQVTSWHASTVAEQPVLRVQSWKGRRPQARLHAASISRTADGFMRRATGKNTAGRNGHG